MSHPEDQSRRRALQCLGWAGAGALFSLSGGIARATTLDGALAGSGAGGLYDKKAPAPLSFVQISDTHIGFSKVANPDPVATLRETVTRIKALPTRPDFVVHTGDVTHLAQPAQFDLAQQVFQELGVPVFAIPGEHDIVDGSDPRPFLDRFGPKPSGGSQGDGWHSFDQRGVHFVLLNNALSLGEMGMGTLGRAQLDWLKADLTPLPASTPIVVLSHFPLWGLHPAWGWGTADAAEALALLARFGSVTSLNGHVHQLQTKVEGHVRFHAARSTAYPQPAPGVGAGPGPLVVPPEQLRGVIGYSSLEVVQGGAPIAVTDTTLV